MDVNLVNNVLLAITVILVIANLVPAFIITPRQKNNYVIPA